MRITRILAICSAFVFSSSILFAQSAADATAAAKTLNLRLVVAAGSKIKSNAKVAVLPFPSTSGQITEFSTYFAAELVTAIFKLKTIQPLERGQAGAIANELSASGDFGNGAAAKAAKAKGAEAVLIGDIAMIGDSFVVNARIVSTADAETLTSANVKIKKNADLERMFKNVKKASSGENGSGGVSKKRGNDSGAVLKSGKFRSFTIDITSCYREGNDIFFDISVTNTAGDPALLYLCRHVMKLYDTNGGAYSDTWVSIGTENSNNMGTHIGEKLPSDVAVKGKVRFKNIPSDVTKVKLLEFGVSQNDDCVKVNFKDIPVAD